MAHKKPRARSGRSPRRTHAEVVHGDGSVTISVDLRQMDLPSQEYEADLLWPTVRRGAVSFMLDRLSLKDESVETRVEVRMPFESFLTVWASTQASPFAEKLRTWLTKNPIEFEKLEIAHGLQRDSEDPMQGRAVMRAHMARISFVGSDAEVSFYAIPASQMSDAVNDRTIETVPIAGVLRVTTTTPALASLLLACDPIATKIAATIKAQEG